MDTLVGVNRSNGCASCATLPDVEARKGALVVSAASVGHRLLVAEALEAMGLEPRHRSDGRLNCPIPADDLPDVAASLTDRLPAEVLDGALASVSVTPDDDPSPTDRQTLRALARGVERAWLIEILGRGGLDTHLQPIVRLDAGATTPFAHECLTRGRSGAGATIPPTRLFAAADRAALLFHLDRSARLASIANAARHDPAGRYFVNFTPTSVYNPAYCLRSTVEAVEAGGIEPEQVTFEVIESLELRDLPHLDKIFRVYRERGFSVALDDIVGGPASSAMIASVKPDFVKIDRSLVAGVNGDARGQREVRAILAQCRDLGIEVVAEGIERPEERDWLADAGIRLMQGYLFARPFPA